jgi:hypothetical protein
MPVEGIPVAHRIDNGSLSLDSAHIVQISDDQRTVVDIAYENGA